MRIYHTSLSLDDQTRLYGSSQGKLFLVADGMGGHAAGQRASALALDSIAAYVLNTMHWFFRLREDREDYFEEDLKAALEHCQTTVQAEAERFPDRRGMGTTLTMGYLTWPTLFVLHVGDSRCYLYRRSKLKQITRDHTVAQRLVEEGVLHQEDVESSKWSHVLWNVVGGGSSELAPEVHKAELKLGDKLLLCTDGLTKHIPDEDIAQGLGSELSAQGVCERLVQLANNAGGSDNITAVVAHFRDAQEAMAVAEAEAALTKEAHATEAVSATTLSSTASRS
jgi:serine/threonine protein phosphatase PrpC